MTTAAQLAGAVGLLANNAGVATYAPLVTGDLHDIDLEMATNYLGVLRMVRAFAPILAGNGGSAILNVLSVMAWLGIPALQLLRRLQSGSMGP